MKKYLFLSLGSLVACIYIIFKVYQNNDIELIDAIVENTVVGLGIKSDVVEKKIERKIEEKRKIEETASQFKPPVITQVPEPEQVVVEEPEPTHQEKVKELFNMKSEKGTAKIEAVDSANFNMLARVDEQVEEEEENAFNVITASSVVATEDAKPTRVFKARIHNTQVLVNDQQIWVRSDEQVLINGNNYPKNTRFQARVNIFQGRILLIVENISGTAVRLHNYDGSLTKGMKVIERYQQGDQIVLSDGEEVTFNAY